MIGAIRMTVIVFVILTVIYVAVSLYSRWVRYGKLKRRWESEIGTGDRDAYIRKGMEEYDRSLRKKLILGVYILPLAIVGFLIYATNFM